MHLLSTTTDRPLLTSIRRAIVKHTARLALADADNPCRHPLRTRDAIEIIQDAYRQLVGGSRDLDWETAANLWDVVRSLDDEPPSEPWMVAVSCYLIAEDYDPAAIRRIVSHVAATGGVEGSELDGGRDSEAVGELMKGRGQ